MKKTYIIPCITDVVKLSMTLPIAVGSTLTTHGEKGDQIQLTKEKKSIWDQEW